jgi:gamma-glutamyl-gamma-aminobutyrate hydrolase PuuD/uncharacterized protein YjbI with pentapeptide repeats
MQRGTFSNQALKTITQDDLINDILPAIKRAKLAEEKADSTPALLKLAEFLQDLGYKPTFDNLNLSILNVTIEPAAPSHSGIHVMRGTDLLRQIDYTGVEFKHCNLDYVNVSDSRFELMGFEDCGMARLAMQNCVIEDVTYHDCRMQRACLDASSLDGVEISDCQLPDATVTNLKKYRNVTVINSNIAGINLNGNVKAINSEIIYSNNTELHNIHSLDPAITLTNASRKERQPAIGICWNSQSPGYAAELARTALIAKDMHPVHLEVAPPFHYQQLKNLEIEIANAAKAAHAMPQDEVLSIPFGILEIALANPSQYPLIITLYQYAANALATFDGMLIPGGADVNPLFYGQEPHDKTKPIKDLRRDVVEFSLLHAQQATGTPVYAICRGSQITALAYGATFHQHISDSRAFIGEKIKLTAQSMPRSSASHMHDLLKSKVGVSSASSHQEEEKITRLNSPPLKDADFESNYALFVHHQGYTMPCDIAERNLFEILATTSLSHESNDYELTVSAESLPRNIFIAQFHPEGGNDEKLTRDLRVSSHLAACFLDSFCARVNAYRAERNQGRLMRVQTKGYDAYMHPKHISLVTSPHCSANELETAEFDTVIVGMTPTGLTSAIAAIQRGERVAFLTDSASNTLSLREKTIYLDQDAFRFIQTLVHPVILQEYLERGFIVASKYEAKTRYAFIANAYENVLLAELNRVQKAGAAISIYEIEKINEDLVERIDMSRHKVTIDDVSGRKINMRGLQDITALRQRLNVDVSGQTLALTKVKQINGAAVDNTESHQLAFTNLIVCSSGKKSLEKSIIELGGGHSLHTTTLTTPHHATVIFELNNYTHTQCHEDNMAIRQGKKPSSTAPLQTLQQFGWTHASRPHSQIYAMGSDNVKNPDRCAIRCEIPEALFTLAHSSCEKDKARGQAAIQEFARTLLSEHFPKSVCENNIVDAEQKSSTPDVTVQPFQVDFFELNQTCILTQRSRSCKPGVVTFLGDNPLLPADTGLQTSATIARYFHTAQMQLKQGLVEIQTKHYDSESQRQHAINKLYEAIYSEYHARSRVELDKAREMQHAWVIERNHRQEKAARFYDIHNHVLTLSRHVVP